MGEKEEALALDESGWKLPKAFPLDQAKVVPFLQRSMVRHGHNEDLLPRAIKYLSRKFEALSWFRGKEIVPFEGFGDKEPYKIEKIIWLVMEWRGEHEVFLLYFLEANLYAAGESLKEAMWHMRAQILDTYEFLNDFAPKPLTIQASRQLKTLNRYIKKK